MSESKVVKCGLCGSDKIYSVRHDSDWGGEPFSAVNEGEYDEIHPDIDTLYCSGCEVFGDHILDEVAK